MPTLLYKRSPIATIIRTDDGMQFPNLSGNIAPGEGFHDLLKYID